MVFLIVHLQLALGIVLIIYGLYSLYAKSYVFPKFIVNLLATLDITIIFIMLMSYIGLKAMLLYAIFVIPHLILLYYNRYTYEIVNIKRDILILGLEDILRRKGYDYTEIRNGFIISYIATEDLIFMRTGINSVCYDLKEFKSKIQRKRIHKLIYEILDNNKKRYISSHSILTIVLGMMLMIFYLILAINVMKRWGMALPPYY